MVAKKKSIFILACMFMASILLAAAFAWGLPFARASAAERTTYTLPNTFDVYSPDWPNEIDNLEESNQLILHSTVNADGNAFSVPAGANAGFVQNNVLGTAGWGLNDLTIKFYLNATPGSGGQIRLYFVNNVGWYNGSTAGMALWLWGINAEAGTANMAIQVKTESGEAVKSIEDAANVPINFDYNYFTDTAKDADDEEGQSAAPAEGSLNTWRFYFDEDGMLMLEVTAAGKDGAEARTMTIDLSPEAEGRAEGVESPQERLYDFSDMQAGETTNMVVWFADGLTGAMRIAEVTSASEETTQDFLPRDYVNASDDVIFGGYNKLGFAKFSGNAVNNYTYAASYSNDVALSNVSAEFQLDAVNLYKDDTFVMTYYIVDELGAETGKYLQLSFKKPDERDAGGNALLTLTGYDGDTYDEIVTDVEVPFTWDGRTGAGGLTHIYNIVSLQNSIGTYSLTVNGTNVADINDGILAALGEGDLNAKLTFGVGGSAGSDLVIKRVVTTAIAEIDTPEGYIFEKTATKRIRDLEGSPMFYSTADEGYEVGILQQLPANSFTINLSLDKLDANTKAFRVGLVDASDTQAVKMLIIELMKTGSNKATVSLIISDSGNETLLDTAENVTFNWGQNSENSVSFLKYDEGEARVFINRSTALRFDNDADLNAFVDDNFAEGGMPAVQSLGDAMSVYVARGVSELVYMSDPAAGWKPGARNENAEFVYGADGSVGIEHTNSTSQMYSSEIAIGSFTATFKTHNWTAGNMTFGLQSGSQNTEWFTLADQSGLIFVLNKHIVDGEVQAGKALINFTWHQPESASSQKDMLANVVVDWKDDVYNTISIRKEGDNWVVYFNDTVISSAEYMEGFDQATFNADMETAFSEFTSGSSTGNGYFVNYADETNTGFVSYFKTLTTGTVSIDGNSTVKVGETVQLTATVSPSMAAQTGTWSSSDTSVATVDENGVVTGVKEGTVTITFTTDDGASASYDITVTNESTNPGGNDPGGNDPGDDTGSGCSGSALGTGIAVACAAVLAACALIVVARKRND